MHEERMIQLKAIVNEHETHYWLGTIPAHAAGPNKSERSQCNKMFHLYLLYTHCVMWMKSYAVLSVKLNIKTIDICIILMKIAGYKSDLQCKYQGFQFNSIIFCLKVGKNVCTALVPWNLIKSYSKSRKVQHQENENKNSANAGEIKVLSSSKLKELFS